MRDETVADGEDGVGGARLGERELHLHDADEDTADHIDEGDDEAGDRVAAHELRRTVHGAEERAFIFELGAPAARLGLVDEASGQIGVNRHLLAGHGVQGEARGDFRDTPRTLGDHDEVHEHQDGEHDDADDEIAAHHEVTERLDDVTGSIRALVAMAQDQARRRQIERETQHGRNQQHGREGGELKRLLDKQRGHQDEDRQDDREGEKQIKRPGRQWDDEDNEDRQDADGEHQVAALEILRQRLKGKAAAAGLSLAAADCHVTHRTAPFRAHPRARQNLPGVWLMKG